MAMKVSLPNKLHCERCGHDWRPRHEKIYICPHCKSAKWNVKR